MNFNTMTVKSLRVLATEHNIVGRSKMSADELRAALGALFAAKPARMTNERRAAVYAQHNGTARLTARQSRRIRQKSFA